MSHVTELVRQRATQDARAETHHSEGSHRATVATERLTGGVRSWLRRWEGAIQVDPQ